MIKEARCAVPLFRRLGLPCLLLVLLASMGSAQQHVPQAVLENFQDFARQWVQASQESALHPPPCTLNDNASLTRPACPGPHIDLHSLNIEVIATSSPDSPYVGSLSYDLIRCPGNTPGSQSAQRTFERRRITELFPYVDGGWRY